MFYNIRRTKRLAPAAQINYNKWKAKVAHSTVGIQISEKRASGIEHGSAACKAPDIPMCQIAPLKKHFM